MSAKSTTSNPNEVTPQQIGKAFVVQYYRLLHEHPESLHRFYSTSSTLMHDDPNKTVSGIENIAKRIEELSLKQRHVKIRQVDCHSTVGSSVVVQVCGEISTGPVTDNNSTPIMKRFVQTFVLAPTTTSDKQKYYVHNDIFRYQENQTANSSADNERPASLNTSNEASVSTPTKMIPVQTPITPSSIINIEFSNDLDTKKDDKADKNANTTTTNEKQKNQEKQQAPKPKSYRDAIAKKEKAPVNESSTAAATTSTPVHNAGAATTTTTTTTTTTAAAGAAPTTPSTATSTKSGKSKKSKANKNKGQARGHPQDADEYYDDSWYYAGEDVEAYLTTGYVDDQEVFVGDLSAQITEEQIREMFRPFGRLLLVRIGNTGSQVGAANFAFCVCQSVDMAKAVVADRDSFFQNYKVNVEAKKRRPFPHTFRPTYPTAASPNNYQSTGYPAAFYQHSVGAAAASAAPFYDGGVSGRGGAGGGGAAATAGGKRGGRGGAHPKN